MDQQTVRQLFDYEPDSGLLRRKGGRKPYPWRKAGVKGLYKVFTYRGQTIYLHRAVWLYHYGTLPAMIDHIDGDASNCRVENLRACTNAQNQYNSSRKSNNRCGYKGVVYHPTLTARPWQAKIVVNRKVVSLGYYSTPESAHAAYVKGATAYAGDFARAA